jgi:hypothetical protein
MIQVLLVLCVIGVIVWLVTTYIPMPGWMKTTITVVAIVFTVLYLLQVFGLMPMDVPVPRFQRG